MNLLIIYLFIIFFWKGYTHSILSLDVGAMFILDKLYVSMTSVGA